METICMIGATRNPSKQCVREKLPTVSVPARHLPRAHVHGDGADGAQQDAGGKAHHRSRGQRAHHVVEQPLDAGGENRSLRALRRDSP